jgi:hypothetical protein
MTLNEKKLREWEKSSFTRFTKEQEAFILERFETELGEGHERTEQDIVEQTRKICQEHPNSVQKPAFLE